MKEVLSAGEWNFYERTESCYDLTLLCPPVPKNNLNRQTEDDMEKYPPPTAPRLCKAFS